MQLKIVDQRTSFADLASKITSDLDAILLENVKIEGGEDGCYVLAKALRGKFLKMDFSEYLLRLPDN